MKNSFYKNKDLKIKLQKWIYMKKKNNIAMKNIKAQDESKYEKVTRKWKKKDTQNETIKIFANTFNNRQSIARAVRCKF